jgi:hypothetical protein
MLSVSELQTAAVESNRLVPAGGDTGQVLTKDSGDDYDVSWQDASGGGGGGGSFSGALVNMTTDDTGNHSSGTIIGFDEEQYDNASIHDTVTNNSRLTVPADVTQVRVLGGVRATGVAAALSAAIEIWKNGSRDYIGLSGDARADGEFTEASLSCCSPVLNVSEGDYFELRYESSDTSTTIDATQTWFAMEIITTS